MNSKRWNSFNELQTQDSEEKLNSNPNAKPSSQKCTEVGEKKKNGVKPGKIYETKIYSHDRYGKYQILKIRSTYILQRSGHSLFSSKDRKKLEDVFTNIIKNNGGFLSTSFKSRT